jgi:hypothetical protein
MPDFKGNKRINLQPRDYAISYGFIITPSSSTLANDGYIPYGTTVSGVVVEAEFEDGTDATSELIHSSSVTNNIVTATLNYPTNIGEGRYNLTFILSLDNGEVHEANFNRVVAKDL